MSQHPHISVLIPTCNQPEHVRRCLHSLESVIYHCWDILVIDQSDQEDTYNLVESFSNILPNLKYKHLKEKGCSRAYNIGITETTGEIVAFLDHDCTVPVDWLDKVSDVFSRHSDIGIVFGTVKSAAHDRKVFFIPVYEAKEERKMKGSMSCIHLGGMGACMYIRREIIQLVGPFDIHLGPGARLFTGGDDVDYRYRCLIQGHTAVITPAITIVHHGARDYESGAVSDLLRGYAYSAGAVVMKFLRCGKITALLLLAHGLPYLSFKSFRRSIFSKNSIHMNLIIMFFRGMIDSFRLNVDQRQYLYASTDNSSTIDIPAEDSAQASQHHGHFSN